MMRDSSPVSAALISVTLRVNGVARTLALEPRVTLLDALREHLGLTGTKKGCNHGECGACTVHLDERRVNACLVLAVSAAGKNVITIEGLGDPDHLHPMQQAFIEQDAFQCGYCTPGQIMSAVACVREGHTGSAEEIREWMSGNICRCSAYPQIVAAVQQVARMEG
ncbi:MAG: (2Fe-2S)-binding protein [Gemmatimonadales bacterium]